MEATDFYLATAGAGAALAGLVIVALSVTVDRVIEIAGMSSRAAATIALLVATTVVSLAGLLPQPDGWFSVEVLVAAAALLALGILAIVRAGPNGAGSAVRAGFVLLPTIGFALGGVFAAVLPEAAVPTIGLASLLAIIVAVVNTWVLLVELKR